MLADVKLQAGGIVFAGAVQTVAPVVVRANLWGKQPGHTWVSTSSERCQGYLPQEAAKDRSAATVGTAVSLLNPEDPDSSKPSSYFQKIRCGDFCMSF